MFFLREYILDHAYGDTGNLILFYNFENDCAYNNCCYINDDPLHGSFERHCSRIGIGIEREIERAGRYNSHRELEMWVIADLEPAIFLI